MVRNKRSAGARRALIRSAWFAGVALFIATSADAQRAGGGRGQQEAPAPSPGGPIYVPPSPAMNISGVWWTQSYSPKIQIVGGGELPYNEKGKSLYASAMAGLKDGTLKDEARRLCVPDGLPRILGNPYPFQLIQTPGRVTFVYELNHVIRPIPLDKPQQSADELEVAPYYSGHSVAHWSGETLVIEFGGLQREDLPRRDRRAPFRCDDDGRAGEEGGRQDLGGRDHGHRRDDVHQAVERALRL